MFGYNDLEDENEALREQIAELEGRRSPRARTPPEQLEEIAADRGPSRSRRSSSDVLARVVGGGLTNFEHTVEIDRGADDGIGLGMPVVTGAGLVGRVVQVTGGRSVVQLITDPGFEVGVRLVATATSASPTAPARASRWSSTPASTCEPTIAVGDAVTTSAVDRSIFPPDIPVGHVAAVELRRRPAEPGA